MPCPVRMFMMPVSILCDDLLPCSVGKVMREGGAQVAYRYTTSTACAAMPIESPSPIVPYCTLLPARS